MNRDIAKQLLDKSLIEGRYPNYRISQKVAQATDQLSHYTKVKGLDKARLYQMVEQLLDNAGEKGLYRKDIHEYLKDVLSSAKKSAQQIRFVGNLLQEMYSSGKIYPSGKKWFLKND